MAFAKDFGIKDYYNYYSHRAEIKNRDKVDYKTFSNVLKTCNLKLRDKLLYESATVELPYRLGIIYIEKFKNYYGEENKNSWRINFNETKKQGFTVYFGHPYGYKFMWDKKNVKISGKRFFVFKPCKKAKRLLADAILRKGLDYYNTTK